LKILITGGAGFVGSNLAFFLKDKYPLYEIIVFDSLKRRGSELNILEFQKRNIKFIHGDIRCFEDLNNIEFDYLIEASAEPSVLAGLNGGRKNLIDINFNGVVNSLEACVKNNAKIIFLSTSRVYSIDTINNLEYIENETRYKLKSNIKGIFNQGFNEEFSINGNKTLYGATKFSAEQVINEYSYMSNVDFIINRSGVIAGNGQFGKVDQGVITLWVANYFFDKSLSIFGNGKQVRDILNVNDLADLIDLQIHEFGKFKNNIFNIGGGIENSISLIELDNLCKDLIKYKNVDFRSQRNLDIKYYVTDNSKISKFWLPKRDVKITLLEILEWIKNNQKELKWIFA